VEGGTLYVAPAVTLTNSAFYPHTVFMCFVWITEQRLFPYRVSSDWCLLRGTNMIRANGALWGTIMRALSMRSCAHIQHNSVNIYRNQRCLQQTQKAKWTHSPQKLRFFFQVTKQLWANAPKCYEQPHFPPPLFLRSQQLRGCSVKQNIKLRQFMYPLSGRHSV
jgi:hypothetical protein